MLEWCGLEAQVKPIQWQQPGSGLGRQQAQCILVVVGQDSTGFPGHFTIFSVSHDWKHMGTLNLPQQAELSWDCSSDIF